MSTEPVALVVIDMQNAFFESDPLEEARDRLTTGCNELFALAHREDWPAFVVRTEHERDRSTWTLNMLEDGQGFLFAGEKQAELVPGLEVIEATDIVKTRDSALIGTSLTEQLGAHEVRTLVLAGVSTHTCVAATAVDAYAHDFDVVLAEDAIASHRPDLHDVTLSMLCREYRFRRMRNDRLQDAAAAGVVTKRPGSGD